MKKWLTPLALLLCAPSGEAYYGSFRSCNSHLDLLFNYGVLRRSEIRNLPLAEDIAYLKPKKVLKTEDLVDRMDWQSALKGSATLNYDPAFSLELDYTYIYPWRGQKTVYADGTLQFPFENTQFDTNFSSANKVSAYYYSQLQNGEANLHYHVTPRRVDYFSFSWIYGLRYIHLHERFRLSYSSFGLTSDYKVRCIDNLYGLQLGAYLDWNPTKRWAYTLMIKGAGFANGAESRVFLGDEGNMITVRNFSIFQWTDSWLLEGYGQIAFYPSSNISLNFGYMAFLLTGLSLAPEQVDDSSRTGKRIRTGGQIVVDGFFIGATVGF